MASAMGSRTSTAYHRSVSVTIHAKCRRPRPGQHHQFSIYLTPGHQGPAFRHGNEFGLYQHAHRRDRLWLLNALALLTLLGAAGEALGYDRHLNSNIAKRRTHSLFRQGCMLYELIPTTPEHWLLPLVERFAAMLAELPVFADAFGPI